MSITLYPFANKYGIQHGIVIMNGTKCTLKKINHKSIGFEPWN